MTAGAARRQARALGREFYDRGAAEVARALLGSVVIRETSEGRVSGRIVETEAYEGAEDAASHAFARTGRTTRNDPLFGAPGTAYIHLNYGIHWCLNAVAGPVGVPHGVLLRALEPLEGQDLMRQRRSGRPALTNGPGRLSQALAIGPDQQRHDLATAPLWIEAGESIPDGQVAITPRIGITKAADRLLRFCDADSSWVSGR
ncbi:MAG: DNA-3-methyladenine glycosylase [Gemmatimonadota bacterium]